MKFCVPLFGCPHSQLREAIIPTPRQQGVDGHEVTTGTLHWSWARLLGRVFALDMATCPFCRQGALRIIAAITQAEVIRKLLRHLNFLSSPPTYYKVSHNLQLDAGTG